jgi:urease subunit beta
MAGPKIGPPVDAKVDPKSVSGIAIGGYVCGSSEVAFDEDRPVTKLSVTNTGDRPIQVGSHFHFFEVNRALEFDRGAAFGLHLNIPSSTAVRFEPGDVREIELVPYGGRRAVYGFNNLVDGATANERAAAVRERALELAEQLGFRSSSTQPSSRQPNRRAPVGAKTRS